MQPEMQFPNTWNGGLAAWSNWVSARNSELLRMIVFLQVSLDCTITSSTYVWSEYLDLHSASFSFSSLQLGKLEVGSSSHSAVVQGGLQILAGGFVEVLGE